MFYTKKFDEPPLLPPGRHYLSLAEINDLCVSPFPESTNRPKFFKALEELIHNYIDLRIVCEVWLDGSYMTEKAEPGDLDLAVVVSHEVGLLLNSHQRQLVEDTDQPEFRDGLDTFSFVRRALDDPLYGDELVDGAHTWHEPWGTEHSGQWLKGFVVLTLGETDVGLRIRS